MKRKQGFVLGELLVIAAILLILAALSARVISSVISKAKIVSARAYLSQLAMAVENVRNDTGSYPACLGDLTRDRNNPPAGFSRLWQGPYIDSLKNDPWNTPYQYTLVEETVTETKTNVLFGPVKVVRYKGTPETEYFSFNAEQGTATVHVENYSLTSCDICVKTASAGWQEVVRESEFKNHPVPQLIDNPIPLLSGINTIKVRARSTKGDYCYISIIQTSVTSLKTGKDYFTITCFGRDKKAGGKGFNQDITWVSNKYPNIQ